MRFLASTPKETHLFSAGSPAYSWRARKYVNFWVFDLGKWTKSTLNRARTNSLKDHRGHGIVTRTVFILPFGLLRTPLTPVFLKSCLWCWSAVLHSPPFLRYWKNVKLFASAPICLYIKCPKIFTKNLRRRHPPGGSPKPTHPLGNPLPLPQGVSTGP